MGTWFSPPMHGSKLNGELNRAYQLVTKARGFKNEATRACGSSVTEGITSETDRWVLSRRGGYAPHQVSLLEPRLILACIAARAMAQGRSFRWCGHWVLEWAACPTVYRAPAFGAVSPTCIFSAWPD